MTTRIAVAGKGGTGKTTISGLLVKYLVKNHPGKAILAVDADANANLNEVLGLELAETIGGILKDVKDPKAVPAGMTKDMFIEYRISRALVEEIDYDLLVMGNPQGPGCYCFPLDLLKKFIEKLAVNYDYLVVDNEAGLEHLSRKILPEIDHLLIISDASSRGIKSAGRVRSIAEDVGIETGKMSLIVTRVSGDIDDDLKPFIADTGLELIGTIPYDETVTKYDMRGEPLVKMPDDSPAWQALEKIAGKLGLGD